MWRLNPLLEIILVVGFPNLEQKVAILRGDIDKSDPSISSLLRRDDMLFKKACRPVGNLLRDRISRL
jgi:hypothetical protein